MQPSAVQKARGHYEQCLTALEHMRSATSFRQFEIQWSRFLEEGHRVFSKLEKGAKGGGPSEGWFGRKKHERRTDPLLRYIHHARNSDEHGIADIVNREAAAVGYDFEAEPNSPVTFAIEARVNENGQIEVRNPSLEGPKIIRKQLTVENPKVVLIQVHDDRFNDTFDPPASHMGKALPDAAPITVAAQAATYFATMLDEAEALV